MSSGNLNEIASKMKAHSLVRDFSARSIVALNSTHKGPRAAAKLSCRKPSYDSPSERLSDSLDDVAFPPAHAKGDTPIDPEDNPPLHLELCQAKPDLIAAAERRENPLNPSLAIPSGTIKPRFSSGFRNPLANGRASLRISKLDSAELRVGPAKVRPHRTLSKTPIWSVLSPTTGGRFCKLWTKAPEGGTLTLEVADTGCGIAEADIPRLFKPFSQANKAVHSKFGGTGLGLWLCDKLIKAMKGEIAVTSVLGKGTTFTITLPLKAKHATPERKVPALPSV